MLVLAIPFGHRQVVLFATNIPTIYILQVLMTIYICSYVSKYNIGTERFFPPA